MTQPPRVSRETAFADARAVIAEGAPELGDAVLDRLARLVELVFRYLTERETIPAETIAPILLRDYYRGRRSGARCGS